MRNKFIDLLWQKFERSGSVADYLSYKSAKNSDFGDNELINEREVPSCVKFGYSDNGIDNSGTEGQRK